MRRVLFILFMSAFFSSACAAIVWEGNYQKAVEKSVQDNKPLLLFFTGSDWSGLSMKMKNEVLNSIDFEERIDTQFHYLEIDFPKYISLDSEQEAQNLALKKRFEVDEYPLLLLLDSNEREIIRVGYLPESGKQLADELLQTVQQDRELCQGLKELPQDEVAIEHLYQLARTLARFEDQKTLLAAGLKLDSAFFLLEQYRLLVEDGKEVGELRKRILNSQEPQVHFAVAMIDFQKRASTSQDPSEVVEPLESYLTHFSDQDEKNIWRIEMMIAQFYLDADECKKALKHAKIAFETAPKIVRGQIENSLTYIHDQIR